jgi:hypothetical protein
MAEPWIRVHASLIDKPVIARAVRVLTITEHAAVGLLVTFWGAASRHVVGGVAGPATDAQLEGWARWRGKRGKFAAFIRQYHLDTEGRVNEWDDYAGALEMRREKERVRLRNKRTTVARTVAQQTQDVATPTRERNETIRELQPQQQKPSRRKPRVGGDEPRVTWLSPTCAVWEAKFGVGSFATVAGQAAKVLQPLRGDASDPEIAERLKVYLDQTASQFVSLTRFAQTYAQWVPRLLVDEHGELTAYGELVTRPDARPAQ